MTRPFLFCLILGLSFLSFINKVRVNANAPKAYESGLVTTEYVDSNVLFITSSDGKVYAYDMEKHNLKWMIETEITMQQWSFNSDYKLDNMDFMLMPSYNGKMQLFSPNEGFQEFEKGDLEQALHKCFSPGRVKYFSKVQETFLLLDLNKGMFWSLEDGFENIDTSRLDTFGVLRIKQYRYNAIDFQNMKEMWSLKTSDLDFFTYFQYLNHGNIPNPSKLLQNYKVICKGGNTIEVLRARDESFLRSIETENEVISVHSLDPNSGFFSLKIESIGAMAAPENDVNQLMVYDQIHSTYSRSTNKEGGDSHELAVFVHENKKESSWISSYSGDIQVKNENMYSSESIFWCIKDEINKRHSIQLVNSSLLENGTINLVVYDSDNSEEKLAVFTNPYALVGTLACMSLTGILSLVIERRRNKKQKKATTSTGTGTMVDSPIEDNNSTGGGSSSSKIKAKTDDGPKERKRKSKKREFEVFTKEVLGLGSHGTIVFQGEFQGKSVAVKRFLKCYMEMARMEIDLLMATEHPNILRYYLYEEDK